MSPAADVLNQAAKDMVQISQIYGSLNEMLRKEIEVRNLRTIAWNKFVQRRQDELDLTRWMWGCIDNEIKSLPRTFGKFWRIIRKCRRSRVSYDDQAARAIDPRWSLPQWCGKYMSGAPPALQHEKYREHLIRLHADCSKIQDRFQKVCEAIQGHDRGNVKSEARCMYKFAYKYNYDARKLLDIVRASFVVANLGMMNETLEKIRAVPQFEILRIKDRITQRGKSVPKSGYRDVLVNVKCMGFVVEIQLHLYAFHELKKDSHKQYKIGRHFENDFDNICYD